MRLSTDDRVWRFQGRLVELDEIEIPLHPRYIAIGIWLIVTPLLMLLLWPFGALIGIAGSLLYGAILAWRLADFITGEVPLTAWVQIVRSEIAARRRWRRDRLNGSVTAAPLRLRQGSRS